VVFNGDILTDLDLKAVIREHNERKASATVVLTPVDNPQSYGLVETKPDGRIKRFLEKPKPDEITLQHHQRGYIHPRAKILDFIPEGRTTLLNMVCFQIC
jgi:NDP-sugar pyrophosphorylase family protein